MAEVLATIITDVITGGTNSHATSAYAGNNYATDFVTQGVVGAIGLNTGSGGTGSFCVNADASPDMGVTVLAGQAYIDATPASQGAQTLRAFATANTTSYTINANSSGSTKYDWIYLQVNATNANNPDAAADNVTAIYTSRSTSNTSDTGSPPTYGLLLAVVTVANGASSITNSNISDNRFNSSIGAQNGSLIVTQAATGDKAIIQAAGIDANVSMNLLPKGTGNIEANGNPIWQYLGYAQITSNFVGSGGSTPQYVMGLTVTVTIPSNCTAIRVKTFTSFLSAASTGASYVTFAIYSGASAGTLTTQLSNIQPYLITSGTSQLPGYVEYIKTSPSSGSITYSVAVAATNTNNATVAANANWPAFILVECC